MQAARKDSRLEQDSPMSRSTVEQPSQHARSRDAGDIAVARSVAGER